MEKEIGWFLQAQKLLLSMTLIVTPKTKKQEKILKEFLENHSINFQSEAEEDEGLLNAMAKGRKSRLLKPAEQANFLKALKSSK